jgi:hypothetical protein
MGLACRVRRHYGQNMRRLLLVVVVLAGATAYIAVQSGNEDVPNRKASVSRLGVTGTLGDQVISVVPAAPYDLETLGSPAASARTFTLRRGDVAVYGKVRCLATIEGGAPYLLCSSRPRTRARNEVAIWPDGINVFRLGNPDPIYSTP